jgi:intraflagellar transport protein 122
MLKTFRKEEVFIVKWNCKFIPTKFYRCTFPEIAIFQCKNCNLFFHEDDYEFEMLKQGGCPFCHTLRK